MTTIQKNSINHILAGASCLLLTSALLGISTPAKAGGPNQLNQAGESATFGTWALKNTKICAQSLDPNNYAKVTLHSAEGRAEDVGTTGGGTNCVERNYVGTPVQVTNTRSDTKVPVRVWSE